jgi:hypothetical protein
MCGILYFGGAIFSRMSGFFSACSICSCVSWPAATGSMPLIPLATSSSANAFDLERMHTDEFGDLLEGERSVIDQPNGGRFRHQRLVGHIFFPFVAGLFRTPRRSQGLSLSRKAPS